MIYIAYIRKSTKGKNRQIQSIPKQYAWVKREAERRGIKIVFFFEDSKSGHKLGREGFEKMVQMIEKSDVPVGIITWKISRLSRNPIDEGIIKYAFMRGKIKHIIARDREYKEGESQIIMGVDFGQATQYSINLSKDVKEGLQKKVEQGYMPNKAPYGYVNDPYGEKGKRKIMIDPVYFKPIQRFLKAYLTGVYSVPQLQKIMTHKWNVRNRLGKPFSTATLYFILNRRFYCGEFLYNGKIKQGKHKPMITIDEFEKIQSLLHGTQKVSENKYQNHYSGYISCGYCESAITGYGKEKHNKNKGICTYHYLRCTRSKKQPCKEKNISRNKIDKQFIELLETISLPKEITDFMIEHFHKDQIKDRDTVTYQQRNLQKEYNKLESEIEILGRKLAKGVIKDELFTAMNQQIEKEQSLIKIKIKKLTAKNDIQKIKDTFSFLATAKDKFIQGTFFEKKMVLKTIGSDFSLKDGNLIPKLHKPFLVIQKHRKHLSLKNIAIEPQKNRSTNKLTMDSEGEIKGWYRVLELLRTSILDNDFIIPEYKKH